MGDIFVLEGEASVGASYRFRCLECAYCAEVSGGDDIGFVVKTKTMYCRTCRQLRDVSVEFWCKDPSRSWDCENLRDEDLHCCTCCGGGDLELWSDGDPCPRCGGQVTNEGAVCDWD